MMKRFIIAVRPLLMLEKSVIDEQQDCFQPYLFLFLSRVVYKGTGYSIKMPLKEDLYLSIVSLAKYTFTTF
jgi:hypothetical protein